jgi:lipoate-protein ligase A
MEPTPIRLLDLAPVSPLRSQTIYHAVGYALGPDSPDTIMLVSPNGPYVSIGRHQDAEREVDLPYCAAAGYPVVRREVGGGAVYLDGDQLFTQWIFQAGHLPATVEERFAVYSETLVRTYHALGIAAQYRPINDIHVAGRKIGGTGAARMDRAEVVVGSLMFDFDVQTMARVLKVPSEKFRDKIIQSLTDYMTTMTKELGTPPPRAQVIDEYVKACSAVLGREVVRGELRGEELALAEELEARFGSMAWLMEPGGLRRPFVKIHEGVRVAEAAYKSAGGLIRCVLRLRDGVVDDVEFTGDFTARPPTMTSELDEALVGCLADEPSLMARIEDYYRRVQPEIPGVAPSDWVAAVLAAARTEAPA